MDGLCQDWFRSGFVCDDLCYSRHNLLEIGVEPNVAAEGDKKKTLMCRRLLGGESTCDDGCNFAHDFFELKIAFNAHQQATNGTKKKIALCTLWLFGWCRKEPETCTFAHGTQHLLPFHNLAPAPAHAHAQPHALALTHAQPHQHHYQRSAPDPRPLPQPAANDYEVHLREELSLEWEAIKALARVFPGEVRNKFHGFAEISRNPLEGEIAAAAQTVGNLTEVILKYMLNEKSFAGAIGDLEKVLYPCLHGDKEKTDRMRYRLHCIKMLRNSRNHDSSKKATWRDLVKGLECLRDVMEFALEFRSTAA